MKHYTACTSASNYGYWSRKFQTAVMVAEFNIWSSRAPTWTRQAASAKVRLLNILCDRELLYGCRPRACSTAHRSNRPDHWDGLMSDRSAVKQLSSLSSRTKLPAGDRATPRTVLPAGNRCHFVLLDEDESCPTADLSNIWLFQRSGLFDRWAVEHAPRRSSLECCRRTCRWADLSSVDQLR